MAPTKKAAVGPGTDENAVNLDFTKLGPRGGGRAAHVPGGDYLLELTGAKNVPIQNQAGRRQIAAQLRIVATGVDDPEALAGLGDTVYQNLQVMPDSKGLWFTRNFIEDLTGKEVTGKAFQLTLEDKIGMRIGATLGDGKEFLNKENELTTRSEVKYTFPADRFVAVGGKKGSAKATANGAASAEDAADAVAETSDEDEEEDIPIAGLESI